ncbi:glycerophosphodiester phosphodiesterase [Granulicatella sp. zg-84]|nr:glycerophosphodiester phosphodiesterase [Granulicatella sp. zg-84]
MQYHTIIASCRSRIYVRRKRSTMKKRYIFLGFVIVYTVLQFIAISPEKPLAYKFKAKNGIPLVIAHGGAKKLFPENTIYAFEQAMALGVDALELDLRLTKDNIVVTHHNETIDETSDGTGRVIDYTYDELKNFNFGAKFVDPEGKMPFQQKHEKVIPMTLDDLFATYAKKTLFIIEIKDEGEAGKEVARQIKKLIEKYDIVEDVSVASFIQSNLAYYRSIKDPKSHTSMSEEDAKTSVYSMYGGYDFFMHYGVEGAQFPTFETVPLDTDYLIWKLKKHNMFVQYWTIDDEETMTTLIQKGVDGIMSDRPDILKKVIQQMKK